MSKTTHQRPLTALNRVAHQTTSTPDYSKEHWAWQQRIKREALANPKPDQQDALRTLYKNLVQQQITQKQSGESTLKVSSLLSTYHGKFSDNYTPFPHQLTQDQIKMVEEKAKQGFQTTYDQCFNKHQQFQPNNNHQFAPAAMVLEPRSKMTSSRNKSMIEERDQTKISSNDLQHSISIPTQKSSNQNKTNKSRVQSAFNKAKWVKGSKKGSQKSNNETQSIRFNESVDDYHVSSSKISKAQRMRWLIEDQRKDQDRKDSQTGISSTNRSSALIAEKQMIKSHFQRPKSSVGSYLHQNDLTFDSQDGGQYSNMLTKHNRSMHQRANSITGSQQNGQNEINSQKLDFVYQGQMRDYMQRLGYEERRKFLLGQISQNIDENPEEFDRASSVASQSFTNASFSAVSGGRRRSVTTSKSQISQSISVGGSSHVINSLTSQLQKEKDKRSKLEEEVNKLKQQALAISRGLLKNKANKH
ncbi:UNKNOWN [Stylonychia lemnae]|uniref:Uncharacterized protein n=1 Tax=Stylonychia lemnae TaxID=5949 RepID=A0A078AXE9_STYLE|nr:UNKNOWN [Stylonychia lemnae]|eukprot:CDW87140.1 UNKNOWN [Stylonychia lemnae]